MKALSIRLPDEARSEWEEIADAHGLMLTAAIRSFLIRGARRYKQLKSNDGENVVQFPSTPEAPVFDFLMAAEKPEERRD